MLWLMNLILRLIQLHLFNLEEEYPGINFKGKSDYKSSDWNQKNGTNSRYNKKHSLNLILKKIFLQSILIQNNQAVLSE
jgi:hypothetical protein